jgi:tetratricopeptide (TPR) repeat protein
MRTDHRNAGLKILFFLAPILLVTSGDAARAFQADVEWAARIRALVEADQLQQANKITDEWLKAYPNDLDARAWHARLQAWANHWKEAEEEYRELIQLSPRDVDLLAGLSDVLIWQKHDKEALVYIDQAIEIDPKRMDLGLRRAQVMQRLGRTHDAQIAFREILTRDASSKDARKGLEEIRSAKRHELRIDSQLDSLSYADSASSFHLSVRSKWNSRWATLGSLSQYHRFGESATGATASATLNFGPRDAITIGGSAANDNGLIPRAAAEFEYNHGFHLSETGPVRGLETIYRQRWLWYRDARLLVISPTTIVYLPKNFSWLFQLSSSRIAASGNAKEWKPSGYTRLSFPLGNRASGNLLFAKGTENFGYADQIGQHSMRTWGAGASIKIAAGQEILGNAHYQKYSGSRTLKSVGASYALHF